MKLFWTNTVFRFVLTCANSIYNHQHHYSTTSLIFFNTGYVKIQVMAWNPSTDSILFWIHDFLVLPVTIYFFDSSWLLANSTHHHQHLHFTTSLIFFNARYVTIKVNAWKLSTDSILFIIHDILDLSVTNYFFDSSWHPANSIYNHQHLHSITFSSFSIQDMSKSKLWHEALGPIPSCFESMPFLAYQSPKSFSIQLDFQQTASIITRTDILQHLWSVLKQDMSKRKLWRETIRPILSCFKSWQSWLINHHQLFWFILTSSKQHLQSPASRRSVSKQDMLKSKLLHEALRPIPSCFE